MPYAIALTLDQARRLTGGQAGGIDEAITFCPMAREYFERQGYPVISALETYRALSHGKTVRAVDRDLKSLIPALQAFYELEHGEAENLSVYLFHFLSIAYYLYFATRHANIPGARFIWIDEGGQSRGGDYAMMLAAIIRQGSSKITLYAHTRFSYPHYLLARSCNRLLALALRLRGRRVVIDFGDEMPKKILALLMENHPDYIVVASKKISKNMYKTAHLFVKSLRRALSRPAVSKPVWVFRAGDPRRYRTPTPQAGVVTTYRAIAPATNAAIAAYIPFLKVEYAIGRDLIDQFRPELGISDFAKYPYVRAAQERLRAQGRRYVMMNHGSHAVQFDRLSRLAANLWAAQDRVITEHVTDHVPKSPLTEAIAREIRADGDYRLHRLNLFREVKKHPTPSDELMILHAGNFTDVYYHIPWCKETSEEYLHGIYELIEEMQDINGATLVIKLKEKKAGAHADLVRAHIARCGVEGKVKVDTTTKFAELLEQTSLIVSNLSGTVEEALINHIPVMFHSYRKRYFHIAPALLAEDRLAPCYLVRQRSDIRRIIEFIKVRRAGLFDPGLYRKVAWEKQQLIDIKDAVNEITSLSA